MAITDDPKALHHVFRLSFSCLFQRSAPRVSQQPHEVEVVLCRETCPDHGRGAFDREDVHVDWRAMGPPWRLTPTASKRTRLAVTARIDLIEVPQQEPHKKEPGNRS